MPSSLESPVQENGAYFNDLSRQPSVRSSHSASPVDNGPAREPENGIPRPKRIACIICRKRKLKCDGTKPSCGTCSRLGHKCSYDEVRRKSGPKRGYVKELEARLGKLDESHAKHVSASHLLCEPIDFTTSRANPANVLSSQPRSRHSSRQRKNALETQASVEHHPFVQGSRRVPNQAFSSMIWKWAWEWERMKTC